MNKYKKKLEEHIVWAKTQSWYIKEEEPYAIFKNPPSLEEINKLIEIFGELPLSYIKILEEFGLSEFTYDCYSAKMLSPKEIIVLYDIVQNEMDFNDGLREEILEEDDLDFSKLIPVMAGKGVDGCWALLDLSKKSSGRIIYWDTDQAGVIDWDFKSLEEFIYELFIKVKSDEPLRLTNNIESLINEPNKPKNVPPEAEWDWKQKIWSIGKKNKEGKNIGEWRWYLYPTGHLFCKTIYEGKKGDTYKYKRFHPDNTISSSGSFLNGLHHGEFILTKSKNPTTEKFMPSNRKINCWKAISTCINGKMTEEHYFDEEGLECYKPYKI